MGTGRTCDGASFPHVTRVRACSRWAGSSLGTSTRAPPGQDQHLSVGDGAMTTPTDTSCMGGVMQPATGAMNAGTPCGDMGPCTRAHDVATACFRIRGVRCRGGGDSRRRHRRRHRTLDEAAHSLSHEPTREHAGQREERHTQNAPGSSEADAGLPFPIQGECE
jgi:hypothetical protein